MTIMQYDSPLTTLGLTSREARVYTSLLEVGPTSVRKVASFTKLNRGVVYETIKELVSKGLVGYHKKGERRKYFAEPPEKLKHLLKAKEQDLLRAKQVADNVIPQLMALDHHQFGAPKVKFYEDDEGIVTILRDVLNTAAELNPKEYFVYSSRPLRQYLYRQFPNFTRRRVKKDICVKVIAIGKGGDPITKAERKYLNQPRNERFSSYNIIYGDKVAMISVSADETPYGVIIEEPGVAAMQKYLFEQLWQSL